MSRLSPAPTARYLSSYRRGSERDPTPRYVPDDTAGVYFYSFILSPLALVGVISNTIEQKDVFLSPVCSIEGDELLSSPTSSEKTMNSIVVSTDSAMTILEPFTEQLWWLHQVQDHSSELESITITISQNILIHLAAESRERLFFCQGIISAMVCSLLSLYWTCS